MCMDDRGSPGAGGQVREEGFDFLFTIGHIISRLHVVVERKASDPVAIRMLRVEMGQGLRSRLDNEHRGLP